MQFFIFGYFPPRVWMIVLRGEKEDWFGPQIPTHVVMGSSSSPRSATN